MKTPIPLARGSFLFGNAAALRKDPLGTLHRAWKKYGDLVEISLPQRRMFVASHPDLVSEIFVHGKHRFLKPAAQPGSEGLELVLGNGLVTNPEHDSWLPQRRMIQPMFHRRRIAQMGQTMVTAIADMLARWEKSYPSGTMLDLHHEMTAVTLDIINRTMFSTTGADQQADRVGAAVGLAAEFVFQRGRSLLRPPLSWPLPRHRAFLQSQAEMDQIIDRIIQQRRLSGQQHDDLLDMLLAARDEETGQGMSEAQLRDEVKTIFAAGHETTANALTWTWYLLAQHPDALHRLQNELDHTLQGRLPTPEDLENLPYTRQVFQEALRLYPPAPLVPRYLPAAAPLGDHLLPPDSMLIVSIFNIHRHPDFWQRPDTFDPDRFSSERSAGRHRYAFMPFGAGPRMCIGNHFAMLEGTLLLAATAQRYELQLLPDQTVETQVAVTMRPKEGLPMRLRARQGKVIRPRS